MNIDDLLKAERSRGGFSDAERGAIWRGVARTIAAPSSALAGASEPSKPDASLPDASAPAAPQPNAPPLTPPSASPVATSLGSAKLIALLVVAAASGALVGAVAQSRMTKPLSAIDLRASATLPPATPSAAPVASPSVVVVPPPAPADAPSSLPASPRANAKVAAPSAPSHASGAPKDPSLARERTLLDMGRTALSRGDAAAALVALDAHAREFPSSQLAQEREVLAIQALVSAGRHAEARARADGFRSRHPHSPFAGVVEEAVR